jgi:hypothetical protein
MTMIQMIQKIQAQGQQQRQNQSVDDPTIHQQHLSRQRSLLLCPQLNQATIQAMTIQAMTIQAMTMNLNLPKTIVMILAVGTMTSPRTSPEPRQHSPHCHKVKHETLL